MMKFTCLLIIEVGKRVDFGFVQVLIPMTTNQVGKMKTRKV